MWEASPVYVDKGLGRRKGCSQRSGPVRFSFQVGRLSLRTRNIMLRVMERQESQSCVPALPSNSPSKVSHFLSLSLSLARRVACYT